MIYPRSGSRCQQRGLRNPGSRPVFTSTKSVHDAKNKGALEPVLALQQSESGLGLMLQSMLKLLIEATTCEKGMQEPHRVCLMET